MNYKYTPETFVADYPELKCEDELIRLAKGILSKWIKEDTLNDTVRSVVDETLSGVFKRITSPVRTNKVVVSVNGYLKTAIRINCWRRIAERNSVKVPRKVKEDPNYKVPQFMSLERAFGEELNYSGNHRPLNPEEELLEKEKQKLLFTALAEVDRNPKNRTNEYNGRLFGTILRHYWVMDCSVNEITAYYSIPKSTFYNLKKKYISEICEILEKKYGIKPRAGNASFTN